MEQSIKQLLSDVNAGKYEKPVRKRDMRPCGAIWPSHNSQDLPADYWQDNVLELI